ncbi:MAG: N-acyl homoserine lactonase family protein [Achromobacter sp.]|nr:N-acyl homoserine lactonase family protein [Achromobacter sp.]
MNCTPFSVYAIRYARHSGRRAADNYLGHVDFHDAESDLDYYVWLLRRDDEIYLVDTGFGEAAARQRGRELFMRPAQGLALLGVQATDVRDVILTHLHYDHAGTLADFPNATFHVQDAEPAYATGRCMCHAPLRHPFDVEDIVEYVRRLYAGRVAFHQGSSELAPGLSLHLVGGHTAGLQIVRVWTRRGWVVLASDASHLYGNIGNDAPFPAVYHVGDMLEGYRYVRSLADSDDHIVPGHDPQVMHRYPAPSPDLEGKIVRLDVMPEAAR